MSRFVVVVQHWTVEPDEAFILDLEPEDEYRAPWSEDCDGCNGEGHLGGRGMIGPCELCFGIGKVLFAFHHGQDVIASFCPTREAIAAGKLP